MRVGRRLPALLVTILLVVAAGATSTLVAQGATPASGTVGPASGTSTAWDFAAVSGGGLGGTPIEVVCAPGQCDKFALTVALPQADATFYKSYTATLRFRCSWTSTLASDIDCFAFDPSGGETGPGKPDTTGTGANSEDVVINNPVSGTWSLRADASAAVESITVHGVATLTWAVIPVPPPFVAQAGDPRFASYDFPVAYQTRDALNRANAGEPSIGADWTRGKVMYMAGNQVTQLSFDSSSPPVMTPTDVTPNSSRVNEDAILFTDHSVQPNRTWALGLLLAGSYAAYSDDAGATWTPSAAVSVPAFPDHETLGAGPYHSPAPSHSYPHAVYYCAQTVVQDAYCGRSDDGGMTFSALAAPLWNGACTPIHGHVRVGPSGNVYVPNNSCTDAGGTPRSGVAVSVDNGQSFKVYTIPDSSPGTSDPSVSEGPDGTIYFGYQAQTGHPLIATATYDAGGLHWNPSTDVGQFTDLGETEDGLPFGVQNTEFSEVIAGDPGRAAFAFLGTGKQGAYQAASFTGVWYMFVSFTYDGGATWRTVNATPRDPVQRGCVWNGGGSNPCRNMLDFNDITFDSTGHVYVAYTDGCTSSATYSCDTNRGINSSSCSGSYTSTATCTFGKLSAVIRQVCGRGLLAATDPGFTEAPACTAAAGGPTPTPTPAPVSTPTPAPGTGGIAGSGAVILPFSAALAKPLGRLWPAILAVLAGGLLAAVALVLMAAARRRRRARPPG